MRLFRKSKKEDSDQIETSEVKVKSPTEIKEEQFQNELDYLQKEIKTKTESYESISKKLSSVKEEYDSAVANLMSAKSELNEKKEELDKIKKEHGEISSKLISAKNDLESIQKEIQVKSSTIQESKQISDKLLSTNSEIQKANQELEEIQRKLEESQSVYDKIEMKKTEAETELHNTGLQIEAAKHEMLKMQSAIKSGKAITLPTKEEEFIEKEISSFEKKESTKQIIEAASAVVASMKTKLSIAEKEVETVNILLKKERDEHQKTKEKLEKLRSKKKKS